MSKPVPPTPANPDTGAASGDDGPGNFVLDLIEDDFREGRLSDARPLTLRFPPEPNGFLHIGHGKSIVLNFGLAARFGGRCHLRFDDTNPTAEKEEFVDAIQEDIRWLGYTWDGPARFASDYFEQLYAWAEQLIQEGKAYVDSQSEAAIRDGRGDFHTPGTASPFRDRAPEESLELFRRMRAGDFEDGSHVLRAKIDMASKDLKLRDPLMYRIRRVTHHRTGDRWCIYPMYDWAHGQSDAIEGISHSLCTLEFVNHHGLYDWFIAALALSPAPSQYEFARLNLTYTVLSKRKLQELVAGKHVEGWDDPRMPTLAGMRRRGVPAEAVVNFSERVGVSRSDSFVDVSLFEHATRETLNATSKRVMAVLKPLRVIIENFDEERMEEVTAPFDPEDPEGPSRTLPLSRVVLVEQDDFMKDAPKKWWRLAPGKEVRLRYGCLITCNDVVEEDGEVVALRCTWDPQSLGGQAPDGRRVRGTLHWVSEAHASELVAHQYDRLFQVENPMDEKHGGSFLDQLNPDSKSVLRGCRGEPSLATLNAGDRVQFERLGYYCLDRETEAGVPIFNRTITLKDSWAKIAGKR